MVKVVLREGAIPPCDCLAFPMTLLAVLALGFFLGIRHATDADHVVAVSTIVSKECSTRGALRIGFLWGLGHTATIVLVGGTIAAFGLVVPPRLGLSMEMSVAVMLVLLGAMNVAGGMRRLEASEHPCAPEETVQARSARHRSSGVRPLVIGVVHGLAGSAAVALLVVTTIRDAGWAFVYLVVFGVGTILGMVLLSGLLILPFAAASRRIESLERHLARIAGVVSILFGLFLAYQIGIVDGLLTGQATWNPK